MKSIQDLRERRAAVAQEARKLLDDNTGAKWTAQVKDQVDAKYAEISDLDDQITALQKQIEIEAGNKVEKFHKEDHEPLSAKVLVNKWMRGGDAALSAEEWSHIRNTMSTTTGSQGGFTVPSEIGAQLYDAMKAFGAMRATADIIKTETGRPLSFPSSDGTAEVGEIIAQNITATDANPTFGTVSLNVFKYGSKVVAAPIELLQDTTIDMEAFIRTRLAQRIGRIQNQHFTTGGGTSVPDGVVPRATSGKTGATGSTLTVGYDDLVDVIHALDPAYRNSNCVWMMGDNILKVIRKLKDSANRPIWMPSFERGITTGLGAAGGYAAMQQPQVFDYLLGYPVYVNHDMANPGANAKTIVFGDMSYYKIRDAMEVNLFRFTDSAYTKLGQVGFLAWARSGGNLTDTAAVKFYQHSAS